MDYKKTTIVFTDADYDGKTKTYNKNGIKLNFYEFQTVSLKMFDKPEGNQMGTLSWDGNSSTIRENDGEYGKYMSGTIQKQELYFSVRKGLARIGKSAPIEVTFREAVEKPKTTEEIKDADGFNDEDTPF